VPPAIYKRGSLTPLYALTPAGEFNRFVELNVKMSAADFTTTAVTTSASDKMTEIGAQIARERALTTATPIIKTEDLVRAQQIPFRGNPTDVKIFKNGAVREAYVPLGGDQMTPGNEVAAVDLATNTVIQRIKVGIRPLRVAVHPAGLIFVCNQFSNYISVIDPATHALLKNGNTPVEIPVDFYCSDLLFAAQNIAANDPDKQTLIVSNSWRASVVKYDITVTRDPIGNKANGFTVGATKEIVGVGQNPYRISLGQDLKTVFVANFRGGVIGRIDPQNQVKTIAITGPVPDVVQAFDALIVPTASIDRGFPDRQDAVPPPIQAAPVLVDGHVVHPGAQFDGTKAYNFEDLRNGLMTIDATLNTPKPTYFTDDISPEVNFVKAQKILKGSMPQAVVLDAARTHAYVPMSGSDVVQKFSVGTGSFRLADGALLFHTGKRPYAVAIDEANKELLVSNWGGETLQVFDLATAALKQTIDLGYAVPAYPATNIEQGEFFYYNTSWSNNGRKSCAQCHWDELLLDGIPYANGATAPTSPHQVPPNFNLMTTDSYFWNGSFGTGTYASLAADAQSRTNCELILFALTEGMAADPATRVGDPNNRVRNGEDATCRPVFSAGSTSVLPDGFVENIAPVIARQKLVRDTVVQAAVGQKFADVARKTDFYSVSELRLPPNPLKYLYDNQQLDGTAMTQIDRGKAVFASAHCDTCHDPNNSRHPYTDGINHGSGAPWTAKFLATYSNDARVIKLLDVVGGVIPDGMIQANATSNAGASHEINVHLNPIDFFEPFCFSLDKCLVFNDPLAVRGSKAEDDRLLALVFVNLDNLDRGFIPGNVPGQPMSNTPSLRGNWVQTNFLRHGLSHSIRETVLGPGHPALKDGELGYAIDASGTQDVHGTTKNLSADDVAALNVYVKTIE
jgi:DNA-binding beta-propeller fold protein YncE